MPGIVVKFDPSFFHQKIFDHSGSNLLEPVSLCCRSAIDRLAEIRDQVICNTHFAGDNLRKLKIEISRGNSYRFPAIDGDVNFESFKRGLEKIGVTDPSALDFLTLINIQNFGGILHTLPIGIWNIFINFWHNSGIRYEQDWHFDFKQDEKNLSLTKFSLTHRYLTQADKKELTCLRLIAEIDNKSLSVTFKEMNLTVVEEYSTSYLESKLLELGYKKLNLEHRSSDTEVSHEQSEGDVRADDAANANNTVIDYQVFPLNRFQICFRSFLDAVEVDRQLFLTSNSDENVEYIDIELNKKSNLIRQLDNLAVELSSACKFLQQRDRLTEPEKKLLNCLHQFLIDPFNILKNTVSNIPNKSVKKYYSDVRKILIEAIILIQGLYIHRSTELPLSMEAEKIINALNSILPCVEEHLVVEKVVDNINKQYMILLASLLTHNQYLNMEDQSVESDKDSLVINLNKLRNIFETFANPIDKNEYKVALNISSALTWLKNTKLKIYHGIKKIKQIIDDVDYINGLFYSEGVAEVNEKLVKLQTVHNSLSEMQQCLRQNLGELNSTIYAAELNDFVVNNSNDHSHINLVYKYRNLLNPDRNYLDDLSSKISKFYNGDEPRVSYWDYLMPWRWPKYNEQLVNTTKYQIKQILQNEHVSPLEHFSQIKKLIDQNKPSAWKWWSSAVSVRNRYENLEKRAYFICLLKAFCTGYVSERQLIQSFKEFKNKINKSDRYDSFIAALLKKYQLNLQTLNASERLHVKSDHANSTKMISEFLSYYSTGKVENEQDLDIDDLEKDKSFSERADEKSKEYFTECSESSMNDSSITNIEPISSAPSLR